MSRVPVIVVRAAGINCDEETMHCWRLAGATPRLWHIQELAERPALLDECAVLAIPGGFSYGDDIAAGAILAQRVMHDLAEPMRRLVDRGGGILGICNGFQVLVKAGLLPGGECGPDQVTVTYNDSAHFEARWVRLEVCTDHCPYLSRVPVGAEPRTTSAARSGRSGPAAAVMEEPSDQMVRRFLEMPVEHGEGKVVTADDAVTRQLEAAGQIALRYVSESGRYDEYPANPNGSTAGIAGLCDPTGRVFGLMPHPDRHFDHTQHPLWTRRKKEGPADGLTVFLNAVEYWKSA